MEKNLDAFSMHMSNKVTKPPPPPRYKYQFMPIVYGYS